MKKRILFVCAWISLGLGVLGIFLPVMPTTPFAIAAAFFFSRSSPRFHKWLIEHKIFGPSLADWEREGAIRARAKLTTIILLIISYSFMVFVVEVPDYIAIGAAIVFLGIGAYIISRPSPKKTQSEDSQDNPSEINRA